MKRIKLITQLVFFLITGLIIMNGCNEPVDDFGFDGQLSGKIVDNSNNIVSGDIKVTTFAVNALGELDKVSMVMRIKGDGTYNNIKLYPQKYKVWLVGPFVGAPTDTLPIDLTGGKNVEKDFQVTPLLTIPEPSVNGTPTSTEIKVDYSIVGNNGNNPNLREIICSTVSWPTRTTGSSTNFGGYSTKIVTVATNEGTATISGLTPNTKYFIRVGARAAGQNNFNHSLQISVTTPSK